jgi:copper(I)-binding protein
MNRIVMVAAAMLGFAAAASAAEYRLGPIKIEQPWSRATPKGATVAAGYLTITNNGTTPDRLVGGSAPFGKFEIHEMAMDGNVMRMRELRDGIEIKPGATVEFKPGSYHLMFTGLVHPLAAGQRLKGTLTFEKAGTIEVEYLVQAAGSSAPQGGTGMPMPGH